MQKYFHKKVISYIALLLAALTLFASCSIGGKKVYITRTGAAGAVLPEVHGIENADSVNASLRGFFGQVNSALQQAGAAQLGAQLNYELSADTEHYTLQSWIEGKTGQKLLLDGILLLPENLTLPQTDFLQTLADPAFLAQCLQLAAGGYSLNLTQLNRPLTVQKTYALLSQYYESRTGTVIDDASVNRPDVSDVFQRKALALMPDVLEGYYPQDDLEAPDFVQALGLLLNEMLFDSYGLGSGGFGSLDLAWAVSFYQAVYSLSLSNNEKLTRWNEFAQDFDALLKSPATEGYGNTGMTRGDMASLFSFIYREYFYDAAQGEYLPEFVDSEGVNTSFSVGQGLMQPFPKENMFYPAYESRFYELPAITNQLLKSCYYKLFFTTENDTPIAFTEGAAIQSLVLLDEALAKKSAPAATAQQKQTRVNDRDYDWYYKQYGTGQYAAVNCMPTMTAMALKWVNQNSTVTVENLRNQFLPEFDDGWWMAQVVSSLESYLIPYEYGTVSEAFITNVIDRGGIVLAMFTEAEPGAQGHCELIYGYERSGNSLRFLVQDPGFENDFRADGNPRGKARWLDAGYVVWTVERMNKLVVSVGTK